MISSQFRTLLLLGVAISCVGAIAALFGFGLLDPNGPVGPGGIVLSFFISMIALVAVVGMGRGATSVLMFEPDIEVAHELGTEARAPKSRFAMMAFVALAIAYFTAVGFFTLAWSPARFGLLTYLLSTVIVFAAGLCSLVAAVLTATRREANLLVGVLSGVMSLPLVFVSGYTLYFFLLLRSEIW